MCRLKKKTYINVCIIFGCLCKFVAHQQSNNNKKCRRKRRKDLKRRVNVSKEDAATKKKDNETYRQTEQKVRCDTIGLRSKKKMRPIRTRSIQDGARVERASAIWIVISVWINIKGLMCGRQSVAGQLSVFAYDTLKVSPVDWLQQQRGGKQPNEVGTCSASIESHRNRKTRDKTLRESVWTNGYEDSMKAWEGVLQTQAHTHTHFDE